MLWIWTPLSTIQPVPTMTGQPLQQAHKTRDLTHQRVSSSYIIAKTSPFQPVSRIWLALARHSRLWCTQRNKWGSRLGRTALHQLRLEHNRGRHTGRASKSCLFHGCETASAWQFCGGTPGRQRMGLLWCVSRRLGGTLWKGFSPLMCPRLVFNDDCTFWKGHADFGILITG